MAEVGLRREWRARLEWGLAGGGVESEGVGRVDNEGRGQKNLSVDEGVEWMLDAREAL
jgi:hypothetical protein